MRIYHLLCLLLLFSQPALAEENILNLANAQFERGTERPDGWYPSDSSAVYRQDSAGESDSRFISVKGDGLSTSYWYSDEIELAPSQVYSLRFSARSLGAQGGSAISGPRFCNRDLGDLPGEWTRYTSVFTAPSSLEDMPSFLRFGQWQVLGAVAYDDLSLVPAQPIYAQSDGVELGAGEEIRDGIYFFDAPFSATSSNHSRPLKGHTCDFNTNRWVFGRSGLVEYQHAITGYPHQSAAVEISIGYYESGVLLVEARNPQSTYVEIGRMDSSGTASFAIPAALLPAESVLIRLRSASARNRTDAADPGAFQVHSYSYRAQLTGDPPPMRGTTHFAEIEQRPLLGNVTVRALGKLRPGIRDSLQIAVQSTIETAVDITAQITLQHGNAPPQNTETALHIKPGENTFSLPYQINETGTHSLRVAAEGPLPFSTHLNFYIPPLYAATPGEKVAIDLSGVQAWQIDSGWKVDQQRPVPTLTRDALYVSAAGGEREALQLVISPDHNLSEFTLLPGPLVSEKGDTLSAEHIDVFQVGYVDLAMATDAKGTADRWPDPLLPLPDSILLQADQNHPFWIRIYVPEQTPPGIYSGTIMLSSSEGDSPIPFTVEVYGFTLPHKMTCSSAMGFSFAEVIRYQRLESEADKRHVLELYLENFAQHRISPYDPAPLDPLQVRWDGTEPRFEWTAWDRAIERAVHHYGFSSFRLPIRGLGSGDYAHRRLPQLNGFDESDPRYAPALKSYLSALESHLEDNGWLDEAYVYFFDEPRPEDYPFVQQGFAKLARYAPKLRRLLTEQVEPALIGGPTIWCPLTPYFNPDEADKRQIAGDAFWWYICTLPKEPYAGLFIDRAGLELRTWLWQTWQNDIQGILIWQSNYWHSGAAYIQSQQNPYADPMSWVSSYSAPVGTRRPWGNGDGRFIYPPLAAFEPHDGPIIAGPVDSQRWEMLRDGIEDYEYFALLKRLLTERQDIAEATRKHLTSLLTVPPSVSSSLRDFSIDPAPLRQHRHALAKAIEELSGL